MLNKKSLALAKTLVSNEGVFIGVKPGSILSEAAISSFPMVGLRTPSLESYSDAIETSSLSDTGGVDHHDNAVANAVDTIGPALIRQMGYVRNVAVPLISKITDGLVGKMKGSEPKEFMITQYNPSPLSLHPYVTELFEKFQSPGINFRRIKEAPEKEVDEIIDGMKTGLSDLDDALAGVIAQDTLGVLDAYNVLFRNQSPTANTANTAFLDNLVQMQEDSTFRLVINDVTQVDFAIVVYFMINAYGEDVLPGTGMSLSEYRTAINNMKAQLGNQILRSLNWINSSSKVGRLIIRFVRKTELVFTTEESEIVVFGPVYMQALNAGCTPESIIGGAINPRGMQRTLNEQVKNRDFNLRLWTDLEKKRAAYAQDTFLKRVCANIAVVTEQALADLPDDAFPTGFNRIEAGARLAQAALNQREFFSRWNYTDDPNLWELVKQKICQYVFTFIDCAEIIDTIEAEMLESGMPAPEAAYAAAIKYLAKWLVANTDICPYKMAEVQGLVSGNEI